MRGEYDAIVIGGGPAGATAAMALASAGWRVAVVEKQRFPRRKVCGEFISLTNWPILGPMGLSENLQAAAGPEVTHFAVFSGNSSVAAELPLSFGKMGERGRALTRDKLDALLLNHARMCGAEILQPWKALRVTRDNEGVECELQCCESHEKKILRAKVAIAAQGSWEGNPFEAAARERVRASDLFGFKAHFRGVNLAEGLMPLLSFQDGYGGMVHCQDGLASLSCCIRRSRLDRLPLDFGESAGERVLAHIKATCPAIAPVLTNAVREGAWLAAGPVRPGIRARYDWRAFFVGNAAGEAHPVIAEGISIAIQSAWLMSGILAPLKERLSDARTINEAGRLYSTAWSRAFATRIRASALIAHWAMRPALARATLPFFQRWPNVLKWFAQAAGKASISIQAETQLQKAAT